MTQQEMTDVVFNRIKELLEIPEIYAQYQKQEIKNEEAAKKWIYYQALITLLYSPEERTEMIKNKRKQCKVIG